MDETPVTPALRASDAEREEVARTLRAHLAAGRLTVDELSERVERAFHATGVDELRALVADLPAPPPAPSAAPRPLRRLWPGNLPFKTRIRPRWTSARCATPRCAPSSRN